MSSSSGVVTILFTDIEGSSRLWESVPDQMRVALATHDDIARKAVERHQGVMVKTTGDGMLAIFADPLDGVRATVALQRSLAEAERSSGIPLRVRCGLHAGISERRDNDFFGPDVNRAARIMGVAHGGQSLLSHAVAVLVRDRLPEDITLRDLGAVRLRDLTNPERVFQVSHSSLSDSFPALRSLEATPNNLPRELTSFVGRAVELNDVAALVRKTRLVTLCGAAGIGKTRLSLHAAAELLTEFDDGAWLVELAPIGDARLVPFAFASVLSVKEHAGRSIVEALSRHVSDRRLLIILDNCEHVLHACAALVEELLQAGPNLHILASSREPMHVSGEATYPVPALGVPPASRSSDPAIANEYESIRLFVDRAVAVHPQFRVTRDNAVAIADICRRLDGIPFAIELAAARARTLSVDAISARLGNRFHLLTRGDRTALPRQQTLRALIDWSHDLLAEDERKLLRRLGVFAGTWTLDAADTVGRDQRSEPKDMLETLSALVEKSLVSLEPSGARYRMLESVREYSLEHLRHSGEEQETRSRHLGFYLALAERIGSGLAGPTQAETLERLDLERENILAAHAWCDLAEAGGEAGLRLLHAIKLYWINRGLVNVAFRVAIEALNRPDAAQRGLVRCRGLFDAGQFCALMGRYGDAQVYLGESLAIARELGDVNRVAAVLQPLAMASLGQRDFAAARAQLDEALVLARTLGDPREIAAALNQLAAFHRIQGELDVAESLYQQVKTLVAELGDRESVAIALLNLAMVALAQGAGGRARGMLLDVLEIARETGSKPLGQSAADVSAGLAATRTEWERAACFFGVSEAQTELSGLHRDPADDAFLTPLIAKVRNALGVGRFDAAEAVGRALDYDDAVEQMRSWLGSLEEG